MPDEDPKKDDTKNTGQDPAASQKIVDGAAPRKRRRRSRKRTTKPKDQAAVVPDLATVHDEAAEELDQPHDETEEFVNAPGKPEAKPVDKPETKTSTASPAPTPAPSSEPSPFDLAASFDNSGANPAPTNPEPAEPAPVPSAPAEPSPGGSAPAQPPSSEPSPFDLSPPPSTPAYEPPKTEKPKEPKPKEPAKDPAPAPSPFDIASPDEMGGAKKENDSFGDYQSPFGASSGPEPEPTSKPTSKPVDELEAPKSDPFSMAPEPEPIAPEPEKKEVLEGEVVSEEAPQPESVDKGKEEGESDGSLKELAMEGTFTERIEQLLHEANLTPRHLKFCCGSLVLVGIIILGGFFLAPKLLNGEFSLFDSDDLVVIDDVETDEDVMPDDTTPPDDVEVVEDTPPISEGPTWVDPSIYGGLLLGDPAAELDDATGVDTGVLVGDEDDTDYSSRFQTFVADLEDIYNLYFVDIDALLDESRNRTETLDEHIAQMKEYYNVGVDHFEEIAVMQTELSAEFDENEIEKEIAELQVFADLNEFKGPESEEQLYLFIELKQVSVDLKARFYVLEKLESMYETVLTSVFTRIKDYELNREALIADVQVVDVEGSDIDLILTEFDLEE